MKRLLTFVACLSLLQLAKAAAPQLAPDTALVPVVNPVAVSGNQMVTYKQRLDAIKKDVPLDYNEYVQGYIDIYLSAKERDDMSHVLGLTKYYFPIYEKAFHDMGIPEEIKYLSIVESQLNPYAVSRVGATGPWQFMFTTARIYGLNIDDYVDERRDPIQSSYAAAAYIKDAYQEFGGWLLAIASYNCGKSNVVHAIEKAGGATDFWSIRQYLPVETRGYVPAYIAITYVMNYYARHNITPLACNFSVKTDTVMVNRVVSLSSISQALSVDLAQLSILNPSYKIMVVNGTKDLPKRLVIPQITKEKYAALYNILSDSETPVAPVIYKDKAADRPGGESSSSRKRSSRNYITYKVHRGDTLSTIAGKFDGVTVEMIKEENGLKKSRLHPGTTLRITKG